jgi:hypothetical protein
MNALVGWNERVPLDFKPLNARHAPNHRRVTAILKYVFQGTGGSRQHNRKFGCVTFNGQITHHIQRNNILMQFRLNHRT